MWTTIAALISLFAISATIWVFVYLDTGLGLMCAAILAGGLFYRWMLNRDNPSA